MAKKNKYGLIIKDQANMMKSGFMDGIFESIKQAVMNSIKGKA